MTRRTIYLLTLFSGTGNMLIGAVVGVLIVPLGLNYWGTERYGLWALLTSVIAYLSMSNLGLNSAATTLMSKDPNLGGKIATLIRSAVILGVSTLVVGAVLVVAFVAFPSLYMVLGRIPDGLENEAKGALILMVGFFLLNLPFSIVSSSFAGFQKAYFDGLFSAIQTVMGLLALLFTISFHESIVFYALAAGMANLAVNLARTGFVFFYILVPARKSLGASPILTPGVGEGVSSILAASSRFFLVSIASMIVWNTDYLVISNFLGLEQVAVYSVTFKVFQILFTVVFALNSSAIPLLAAAFGGGDWAWITRVVARLQYIMATVGGLVWLGGVLLMEDVIVLWTGGSGYSGFWVTLFLGGYAYLLAMVNLNSGIVSSFNYLKGAPLYSFLEAFVKISASLLFVSYLGTAGVALSTLLGSLLTATWILPMVLRRRSGGRIQSNVAPLLRHLFLAISPTLAAALVLINTVVDLGTRLFLAAAILFIYGLASYVLAPAEIRSFVSESLARIVEKLRGGYHRKGGRFD